MDDASLPLPPPLKRARTALSEQRAWAIATAVAQPLLGRVRLVRDESLGMVDSYVWIEIDTPKPDKQPEPRFATTLAWVKKAREACVVWHMLACCDGFRGHENDVFWKRLFAVVSVKPKKKEDSKKTNSLSGFQSFAMEAFDMKPQFATDECRFFGASENDSTFPRFRIKVPFPLEFDEPPHPEVTNRYWQHRGTAFMGMGMADHFDTDQDDEREEEDDPDGERGEDDDQVNAGEEDDDMEGYEDAQDDHARDEDDIDGEEGEEQSAFAGDVSSEPDDLAEEVQVVIREANAACGRLVEEWKLGSGDDMDEESKDGAGTTQGDEDCDIESASDWFNAVIRCFVGFESMPENATLAGYVKELWPHVDQERFLDKPVEIGALMAQFYPLKHMATKIRDVIADFSKDADEDKGALTDGLLRGLLRFPRLDLSEFAMDYMEPLSTHIELQLLTDIIETCQVTIPEVQMEPSVMIDDATFARFIRSVCITRGKKSATIETLSLTFGEATSRQVEIIFSALPLIGVRTLALHNARSALGRQGWAWLAYGLFHPAALRSRLKMLDLRGADVSEPDAVVLQSVQLAQEKFYQLLHDVDDDSDASRSPQDSSGAYAIVLVQAEATCFTASTLRGQEMCVIPSRSHLTAVVKKDANSVGDLGDAVCVVVPCCGRGWIAKSHILGFKRVPSENASILGLAVGPAFANRSMELHVLGPLLKSAIFLEAFEWGKLTSSHMLALFRVCGGIKELSVQHRGDVFNSWTSDMNDQQLQKLRLETLNMTCYEDFGRIRTPSLAAWQSCLRQLRNVVIHTFGPRALFEKAVRQFVQDGWSIEHFVWNSCSWAHRQKPPSYEAVRAISRELLGISKGNHDMAQRPMTTRARAAFASVVKHKGKAAQEPLGNLSQDVIKLICAFSTSDTERIVWVDDA